MKIYLLCLGIIFGLTACEKEDVALHEGSYSIECSEGGTSRTGIMTLTPAVGDYKITISVSNYLQLSGINSTIHEESLDIPSQELSSGTVSGWGTCKEGVISFKLRCKKSGVNYSYNISGKKKK